MHCVQSIAKINKDIERTCLFVFIFTNLCSTFLFTVCEEAINKTSKYYTPDGSSIVFWQFPQYHHFVCVHSGYIRNFQPKVTHGVWSANSKIIIPSLQWNLATVCSEFSVYYIYTLWHTSHITF